MRALLARVLAVQVCDLEWVREQSHGQLLASHDDGIGVVDLRSHRLAELRELRLSHHARVAEPSSVGLNALHRRISDTRHVCAAHELACCIVDGLILIHGDTLDGRIVAQVSDFLLARRLSTRRTTECDGTIRVDDLIAASQRAMLLLMTTFALGGVTERRHDGGERGAASAERRARTPKAKCGGGRRADASARKWRGAGDRRRNTRVRGNERGAWRSGLPVAAAGAVVTLASRIPNKSALLHSLVQSQPALESGGACCVACSCSALGRRGAVRRRCPVGVNGAGSECRRPPLSALPRPPRFLSLLFVVWRAVYLYAD